MAEQVSVQDLQQFYLGTLVLYKGKIVKVKQITEGRVFKLLDLVSQKTIVDGKAEEFIQPPQHRLGFINYGSSVYYASRQPVRKMCMGIGRDNLTITYLPQLEYPEGLEAGLRILGTYESPAFSDMFFDKYPSIKECQVHCREFGGAMAFDKQFAISKHGDILYKTLTVGTLPKNCSTAARIRFEPQYSHLIYLLEDNHEKDLRAFETEFTKKG